jgi:hypothetical protein
MTRGILCALAATSLLMAGLAPPAVAQDRGAIAKPSARAMALARRYADAIHMDNQLAAMMNGMMPAMLDQAAKRRGAPVTAELKEAVARASADAARAIAPRMIDRMTPFIAESFTEEELAAAVAYYESPLAQSLLAKSPQFIARTIPAMMEMSPEIEAEITTRICKEIGCDEAR